MSLLSLNAPRAAGGEVGRCSAMPRRPISIAAGRKTTKSAYLRSVPGPVSARCPVGGTAVSPLLQLSGKQEVREPLCASTCQHQGAGAAAPRSRAATGTPRLPNEGCWHWKPRPPALLLQGAVNGSRHARVGSLASSSRAIHPSLLPTPLRDDWRLQCYQSEHTVLRTQADVVLFNQQMV